MINTLKKTLYAGIGATLVTAEKMEAALNDLVERGKLSAEEARQTAEKISAESKQEFEEAQSSIKELFHELLEKSPVVQRKELNAILERLDTLEKDIQQLKS